MQLPFKLDLALETPLYEQLYQGMKRTIKGGVLTTGSPLPSEREIVEKFQVTRPTLRRALERLEREGLIVRRHGVGSFVNPASEWRSDRTVCRLGIIAWETPSTYSKDVFGLLCAEAASAGMQVHTLVAPSKAGLPDLEQQVVKQSLSALIALPTINRRHFEQLSSVMLPKVVLEIAQPLDGVDHVVIDSTPGVYAGVSELIAQGHHRIMYVGGLIGDYSQPGQRVVRPSPDSEQRFAAYRRALADGGIGFQPEWLAELPYTPEVAHGWFTKLNSSGRLPTAFVVFDDMLAEHIFESCAAHGLRVPGDVSVLGFGNYMPRSKRGELATVTWNLREMAELSVKRIEERLKRGGLSGVTLRVGTEFKPGGSIGPVRGD